MLRFDSVNKNFTRHRAPALDGVSFEVKAGEIFGLLGHNGAGKSTAMGVMLGLVHPHAGEAFIDGISVQKQREKALECVGAIFESPRFYEYLSGYRNLRILAGYSGYWDEAVAAETVRWVGLTDAIDRKVGTYSQGMRQRLALAQSLLPRPRLLLLDEPTNGLDPDGIVELRESIRKLRDELGITVLLNSHLLSEVEQLCDRVAILRKGKIVFEGEVKGLGGDGAVYHLDAENWNAALPVLQSRQAAILEPGKFRVAATVEPADLVNDLVGAGVRVREFRREKASLESLYLEVNRQEEAR